MDSLYNLEFFVYTPILFCISIVMVGLLYFAWQTARKLFRLSIIVDLIFFFCLVKIGLHYLLPTVLRLFSNYRFIREDGIKLYDLATLYTIELISWFVWTCALLTVFYLIDSKNKKEDTSYLVNLRYGESKAFLYFVATGFIYSRLSGIFKWEDLLVYELFKPIFYYAGLVCGPFLLIVSSKIFNKQLLFLGLVSSLFIVFSVSTRGAFIYSFLWLVFLAWIFLRDRKAKLVSVLLGASLAILYFCFGGFMYGLVNVDETGIVNVGAIIDVDKKRDRDVLEEIEWRLGASTRVGTAFINLYERGESAGTNPIKHSLLGFLPRSLNPDKPHPSTLYGDDIFSMGMYIIYREVYGYDSYNMVEFPTGAHFYWEFGLIGVLLLSAISGIYVALCAHLFSKLGIIALPLMVVIFKPWGYVDPKIWVSDIILQCYQIIIPLILLFLSIRFFRFLRSVLMSFGDSPYYKQKPIPPKSVQ